MDELFDTIAKAHHTYPCTVSMAKDREMGNALLHVAGYNARYAVCKATGIEGCRASVEKTERRCRTTSQGYKVPDDILEYWSALARELAARFHVEEFDTSSAMWSWDNFGDDIRSLRNRFGIGSEYVDILGLRVDFETGETIDTLTGRKTSTSRIIPHLYYHSKAQERGLGNEWVDNAEV